MKEQFKPEFNDLFERNNLDFLEKAWKHKIHIVEEL